MHEGIAMWPADCPRAPAGACIGSESRVRNAKRGRMSGPRAGIAAKRGGWTRGPSRYTLSKRAIRAVICAPSGSARSSSTEKCVAPATGR